MTRGAFNNAALFSRVMQGDKALLASLAENAHDAPLEIQIDGLQFDEFGNAHTRGVQQFQHGPIPEPELAGGVRRVEQTDDLILRQHVGQEGGELGRVDEGGRVGGQLPPFDAPCEETAQGRNAPRERAGCVAAFAQPGDEQRDVFVVEAAEGRFQLVEEVPERVQILPVGGDGVAREPPFGYESIKPAGSQSGGKTCRSIGALPVLVGNGRCMDSRGRLHVRRIHQSMGNRKPVAAFGVI